MSIAFMAAAWKLEIPMTEKMVLLCLADFSNDEGHCWPAVGTIAGKCSCTDRTVQNAIKALKKRGMLTVVDAPGKPHQYRLEGRKIFTPEYNSPPKMTTKGVKDVHHGGEGRSPKPSYNHQEPPVVKTRAVPDWMPLPQWEAYLAMRKSIRKPPTPDAVKLLIGKLERWRAAGHDPGAILDNSTENSWAGIFEPKATSNGNYRNNLAGSTDRRDGAAKALDRMLGIGEPSGEAGRYDPGQIERHSGRALPAPRGL